MKNDKDKRIWSVTDFVLIEASLWIEDQSAKLNLAWLESSWQQARLFLKALHAYWELRQVTQSKSVPGLRYDFFHDLIVRHNDQTIPAYLWFDQDSWRSWTYAELAKVVNGLAASWESMGVQPGDKLTILHQEGPFLLTAFLAGLRLGLVVSLLPPQGNAFVQRRLKNLEPKWLAIDHLYRHQLGLAWQSKVLPNNISSLPPERPSHDYLATDVVVQCIDPISPFPELIYSVNADTLYLGAIRDSVLALGIKPGQKCAAPGWYSLESQPSMLMAVLMSGATWVHIDLADIENDSARLLEQSIDILGISRSLRDVLRRHPPVGEKNWLYWFRHPAESADFVIWQDFVQLLQLENCYSGNLLFNTARGGALLFSVRCRGRTHNIVLPAAGISWQLSVINSSDIPCLGGFGQFALGKVKEDAVVWTGTPYILIPYQNVWHYLGHYPRFRSGRTYPRLEVLDLLKNKVRYMAMVNAFLGTGELDQIEVLLVFSKDADASALHQYIADELGDEFLPDRIECLQLMPKLNEGGGVDQKWCQSHYLTGELYRRQRCEIHRRFSELKQRILA